MKSLLFWTAIALAASGGTALAQAQAYPSKQIRIIVPYPAGAGTDLVARLVAQKLGEGLGRTVLVENRIGANGIVGTEAMAKAAPDGYTLGMATPGPITVGKSWYPNLPYDPERDLAPVIMANESANVLAIHPSIPARSVKELVAIAKVRRLNAAVGAVGSLQHLLTEMLNHEAQVQMVVIPYKGGALAATEVVGGQTDLLWSNLPVVMPFIQNGRLRVVAVASTKRTVFLPNVQTMGEAGWPAVVATGWNGIVVPAGTPKDIIDRLNAEIARGLSMPDVKERYANQGLESVAGTPEEFGAFMRAETAKWAQVIKTAKIKLE
jgi:tripartite-type tricarboxylate transporter receptor subunit TctC